MKRVLLIGAGHAHLVVLRALAAKPLYGARITLVSPRAKQAYSGMLPGVVAGHYRREEAEIDVAALAERAYVEFDQGQVERLDAGGRRALLKDGRSLAYDIVSLNIGSLVDTSMPGSERALPLKPYDAFLERLPLADRVAIAGAGAAGAELAMALRYRGARVTLYSEKAALSAALAQRSVARMRRMGVDYRPGMPVTSIESGAGSGPLLIAGRSRQEFDLVLLTTGAVAPPWLHGCGVATDKRGFVLVSSTLQSITHPEVFALGDCATLSEAPHPKSGVYAVRHGETLAANLGRLLGGAPLEPYLPQQKALLLLTCGARYAIAERGAWTAQGRWVWWWKNRIDRRWVASFG